MPIDMPVSKLQTYMGRNEIPTDMDTFWDRSIKEMETLGTSFSLVPAKFQIPGVAECYDLYFYGMEGARIHCRFARPTRLTAKVPAVIQFHGYSSQTFSFSSMMAYAAQGFIVGGMDCRGQGGTSEDVGGVKGNTLNGHIIRGLDDESPDRLYYRNVYLDAAQFARIIMSMDEVDETKVGVMGGSQGGGISLACAALTPSLNRTAANSPFLCDYRRVWELNMTNGAYGDIVQYFRNTDPLHEHEIETFTKLGYIDNVNLAHRIRAKVLMFTGLMDYTCPPSTQFAVYNNITSPKDIKIYPDYGHEPIPECDNMTMLFMREMFNEVTI